MPQRDTPDREPQAMPTVVFLIGQQGAG